MRGRDTPTSTSATKPHVLEGERFVVCDGLKGLPDSVNAVFPRAIVQTCLIHLIRAYTGTFR